MSDPREFHPTPQQLAEIKKAIDLTNQIAPLLKSHGNEVVGATLATLVATWIASYRLKNERAADNSTEGHQARVNRLARFMGDVVTQIPDIMHEIDQQIAARHMSRKP
jgi:hypothetical protein